MKLDAIDLRILAAIQRDGRITKLRLAELAGLSPTPCWLRLRKLEQAGLSAGYHARIAPRRVAPFADFDRFERAIAALEAVTDCWSVGGGVDYILKVVARDIDAYQRLIDRMLAEEIGVDRYFTYIVTRTVKEGAGLPVSLFAPE